MYVFGSNLIRLTHSVIRHSLSDLLRLLESDFTSHVTEERPHSVKVKVVPHLCCDSGHFSLDRDSSSFTGHAPHCAHGGGGRGGGVFNSP